MLADIWQAFRLIATGDAEVWQIAGVSLEVSIAALALATSVALPLAYLVHGSRGRLATTAEWIIHTATQLPTVVVGLTLYFAFSAAGPLGSLNLLYTRGAMIVGQFVLALPIVAAVALVALRRLPREARETVLTLGLSRLAGLRLLMREVQSALAAGVMLAFARVFTELGAAIILGGNIRGATRTLTTVIALEYNRGEDARAIALGMLLVLVALGVNAGARAITTERAR